VTPAELAEALQRRGVILIADGNDLRVRLAPNAVTNTELLNRIRENKLVLLECLRAQKKTVQVFGFDTETVDGEPITLQWAGPAGASLFRVSRATILATLAGLFRQHGNPHGLNLLWAHNLGFDLGVALLCHLEMWSTSATSRQRIMDADMVIDVSFYKGSLLFAEIKVADRCWRILDTMSFFKMSLNAAGERLHLPVRKLPRPSYLGQRLPTSDEWPTFEEYAKGDALTTYHLGQFIVEAHREFGMMTPTSSVAKMGSDIFCSHFLRASIPACRTDDGHNAILTASRESYHGGKNGLYVEPGVYEDVTEVDIVSASPAACS
jgi:hypothetical protein